jgi:hypothetical protein
MAPVALLPGLLRGEEKGETGADAPAKKRLLPFSTIFKGEAKFEALVKKAQSEGWAKLPIGERVAKFGQELIGVPYVNFTLEIDDHIESPSVNLAALDCWTFFEQSLGLARMIGFEKPAYTPDDLLRQIEFTRYRGGGCTGNYLERIHFLAEWFFENDARGVARHLTSDLPGATAIAGRKVSEMTTLWKSYRYLRNSPELRGPMKETEDMVARLPVYHIPKAKVAAIEPKLQSGDIIGIATKYNGAFCSHVGLALKNKDGEMRFMHASRNYKKVVVDKTISGYLSEFSAHAGILVGRPLEVSETVTDKSVYEANLKKLLS